MIPDLWAWCSENRVVTINDKKNIESEVLHNVKQALTHRVNIGTNNTTRSENTEKTWERII